MQMKTETRVTNEHIHPPENKYPLEELEVSFQTLPRIPFLALIRLYQKFISPAIPGNTCRFYPTCSHYSYRAIYKYGVLRGSLLAIWRVLRCNPFTSGGHDPVP
jgi:hypothetical protein